MVLLISLAWMAIISVEALAQSQMEVNINNRITYPLGQLWARSEHSLFLEPILPYPPSLVLKWQE